MSNTDALKAPIHIEGTGGTTLVTPIFFASSTTGKGVTSFITWAVIQFWEWASACRKVNIPGIVSVFPERGHHFCPPSYTMVSGTLSTSMQGEKPFSIATA